MGRYDVTIYCDGSADLSDGSGGWAAILIGRRGKRREFKQGFYKGHTNQTAEIMAAILGLSKLKKDNLRVLVRSDSKYLIETMRNNWIENWRRKEWKHKSGERPNRALWETLESLAVLHTSVTWEWVKGHAGDEENERCDQLAGQARITAVTSNAYFEQLLEVRRMGGVGAESKASKQRKPVARRGRRVAHRG